MAIEPIINTANGASFLGLPVLVHLYGILFEGCVLCNIKMYEQVASLSRWPYEWHGLCECTLETYIFQIKL